MCTKHIDIKYHFIRELKGNNFLDVSYVHSEDNYADLTTKNVSNEIFERLHINGVQIGSILILKGRMSAVQEEWRVHYVVLLMMSRMI